jgi:hypothetical protein
MASLLGGRAAARGALRGAPPPPRCAAAAGAGGNAAAASAPPSAPPPAPQRAAVASKSVWDSLGSSTAERDRAAQRAAPPGRKAPAPARRGRRPRDGAADPEVDEEEAMGWKVIETREGSDGGDDEPGGARALPAEMRCFDRAKIFVKAGDGGMGATAFRHEAHVAMGGPSGGNGGDGGSVWIVGDAAKNSLLTFRKTVRLTPRRALRAVLRRCGGACGRRARARRAARARAGGARRRRLTRAAPPAGALPRGQRHQRRGQELLRCGNRPCARAPRQ